jgi:hypothetical protein
VEHLKGSLIGKAPAFPTHIRLGGKGFPGANTLAYFIKIVTYGRKKFYNIAHREEMFQKVKHSSGLYYKQVTIIIYDHNDSGQYYKTTITIVIALASIVKSDDPNCSITY